MNAAIYQTEQSSPARSRRAQIAVTIVLGIPMTLGLVVALVFYCSYELLKFALSINAPADQPFLSQEQAFTRSLSRFASIHPPTKPVNLLSDKPNVVEEEAKPYSIIGSNKDI